jgi:hypothetical protein
MSLTLERRTYERGEPRDQAFAAVTAAWTLVMNALLVKVAPLTVEMLPDCAEMTRDLSVGTALLVIDVDWELVLVVVAVTAVILPPDTVIETATVPYWWLTVGPANVPFLNPEAAAEVVAGAAVVAFAVVAAVVVTLAAVVAAAAEVPAFVAAAVVAAAVVPALLAAALDAAADAEAVAAADSSAVVGVTLGSVATATAEGSPDVSDVGSAATAATPPVMVAPPIVAADHAAARMPADVATAATLPRALTRRTFRCGSRPSAYQPPAHPR